MEPSSRQSTDSPPTGPLPLFEAHLRLLSDSFIAFFQERKRIEETYVDSLLKLHKKIKTIDAFLDDRTDLSTTRHTWAEVRDNTEREAQARQAFLSALTVDVLNPLTSLRETQERTRKRIKEDIKDSTSSYDDFAENGLPKLRSKYTRKFAEVEENKRAAASVPPVSPTTMTAGSDLHTSPKAANVPLRVTSPQPLRALERRPSGSAPSGRNRSPSSSTAFSDLAQQGKKQLNQLRGLLEKSGTVKESLGSGKETHALKAVRAKRELEEADKDYRNGVHWLETLRLRRFKILESGFRSLEAFVHESSSTVKSILEKYTDNMTATSTTQAQLATHARAIVNRIVPGMDIAKLSSSIPRSLASAIPDRILYQNGFVGECQDLIFGFSLLDYATAHNLPDGLPPRIVQICIAEIDKRGLASEGIYRVSGRHAIVQNLHHEIERDESKFEFKPKDDIFAVASLLKLYLRELPEPVFRFSLQDRMQHTEDLAEHQSNNFVLLRSKIRRLPPVHQATLKVLVEHLARVVANSNENKMDAKNVAIVFGGVIFGEDDVPKGGTDLLNLQSTKDSLMEDLILHAHILYDDQPIHHSPPLPATPAGEPVPPVVYGSKRTQVATVPPSSPPNRATTASPQDFTPRLPSRPVSSIHPSARANPPPSPTKERVNVPPPPAPAPAPPIPSQFDLSRRPSHEPSSPTISTTTLETETSFQTRTSLDLESTSEGSRPPSTRQSLQLEPVEEDA
ncbi:Glucosamine 6-phosphate N-acetyltransferase [Mycena indigotica]|uniref:Glucosamine 6-phosphate N-acetyltransferase n=1 Tax=Mycena indigotica TaxID=2126181 RepID=A0A8H6SVC4_9AGAR|nr:Glucosamine 6-phosphate N-acetyltransferase [Mycena indigotica]KAF7306583.1 Glucosamine 6-phosphate N-acetyltransferase [Mycena indigotica]